MEYPARDGRQNFAVSLIFLQQIDLTDAAKYPPKKCP
jgi:hypothetical protein